ncbi:MAG: YfhO family protein [Oscillospiraceae bacterium]|jgi:uncharacterized membrane protein YfhO|nr:YfhO family protein [Oscillospiraceae bacterium]
MTDGINRRARHFLRPLASPGLQAYAVTFAVVLLAYAVGGVYPFGDRYMIYSDGAENMAPRVVELYDKLKNGGSFYYSWRGGLGIDWYFSFLVALIDPFIWLGFPMGAERITEIFALMYLFQIPISAATFAYFLNKKYGGKGPVAVALSVAYALTSQVIAYVFAYNWELPIAMLPLVALGIDKLMDSGDIRLYSVSLALGIMFNFMMGMFLCFGSVLYYLFEAVSRKTAGIFLSKTFARYAAASALGLLLAAWVLIPAAGTVGGTAYNDIGRDFGELTAYFSVPHMLLMMLFGVPVDFLQFTQTTPAYIYSGAFTLLLLALFFFNAQVAPRRKAAAGAVLLALLCAVSVSWINYTVHGFHWPVALPHRFAFLFPFFALMCAFEGYKRGGGLRKSSIARATACLLALLLMLDFRYYMKDPMPGYVNHKLVLVNAGLLLVYSAAIWVASFSKNVRRAGAAGAALALLFIAEIAVSTAVRLPEQTNEGREKYILSAYDDMQAALIPLNAEPEFYRAAMTPRHTESDGRLFGFKSVSTFSEGVNGAFVDNMEKFGFWGGVNSVSYGMESPLWNALLGIKYSINSSYMRRDPPLYYEPAFDAGELSVYENPYALPIGFLVNDASPEISDEPGAGFLNQNAVARAFSGVDGSVYGEPLIPSPDGALNLKVELSGDGRGFTYAPAVPLERGLDLALVMAFTVEDERPLVVSYSADSNVKSLEVYIDGVHYRSADAPGMYLAPLPVGTKLSVKLSLDLEDRDVVRVNTASRSPLFFLGLVPERYTEFAGGPLSGKGVINVVPVNEAAFKAVVDKLRSGTLLVSEYDDTHISGVVDAEKNGTLLLTIPYDERWHIRIDGEERETTPVMGAFTGVELEAGRHTVELVFRPGPAPVAGVLVSVVGVVMVVIILKRKRASSNKPAR